MKAAMKKRLAEFVRFGVVGVVATAIHYGLYYLLQPHMNATVAYSIGYAVSFVLNYVLSSLFTFRVQLSAGKAVAFLGGHAVNYVVGVALLNIMLLAGVPRQWAPLPVFVMVVPINFLVVRFALVKVRSANNKLNDNPNDSMCNEADNHYHSGV